MLNNDLLKTICELYKNKAEDIGESIGLLNMVLDELLNAVNLDVSKNLTNRNYDAASKSLELHKKISEEYEENSETIDFIENSIAEDLSTDFVVQTDEDEKKTIPDYSKYTVDQTIPHTLYENFEFKRPIGFKLYDKTVEATNWANVLQFTCELLYNINSQIFNSFISDKNMNGKKKSYFAVSEGNIRKPRKLHNTDIYIETNLSANSIKQIIIKMLKKYQIKLTDYIVFFRADYTEIGKQ
ncbi:MAG: hypothetical protein SA378_09830 [Sedimentibacter sp.]|uniref:hypothetical protein n=1 Tax=Sedimentibacter sp. TaxID=1960295 RepID=UPI002981B4E2|nr:hypothetical protein [Sedimentibacter sp.]MDW5300423.1 hypothetical protein [Sedimentibacter sp.]